MAAPGPPFRRMGATFLLLLLLSSSCNALWLRLYVTGMFFFGWRERGCCCNHAMVCPHGKTNLCLCDHVPCPMHTRPGQTNFHQLPSAFSDGGLNFQAGAALINTAAAQGRRSRQSWEQETPSSSSSSSRAVTEAIIKDTAG
jgi:hypothetical protein